MFSKVNVYQVRCDTYKCSGEDAITLIGELRGGEGWHGLPREERPKGWGTIRRFGGGYGGGGYTDYIACPACVKRITENPDDYGYLLEDTPV